MNKLNNKLLTILLFLGTICFIAIIYMFATKELFAKPRSHKVSFDGVTVVKNEYADSTISEQQVGYEEEYPMASHPPENTRTCSIDLINLSDNLSYAKTNEFDIRTIRNAPNKISSNTQNETALPSESLKESYQLRVACDHQIIEVFPLGTIDHLLNLQDMNNADTEKRDIKLTSKDKKLILFVNFTID